MNRAAAHTTTSADRRAGAMCRANRRGSWAVPWRWHGYGSRHVHRRRGRSGSRTFAALMRRRRTGKRTLRAGCSRHVRRGMMGSEPATTTRRRALRRRARVSRCVISFLHITFRFPRRRGRRRGRKMRMVRGDHGGRWADGSLRKTNRSQLGASMRVQIGRLVAAARCMRVMMRRVREVLMTTFARVTAAANPLALVRCRRRSISRAFRVHRRNSCHQRRDAVPESRLARVAIGRYDTTTTTRSTTDNHILNPNRTYCVACG
jgi:hypothetical protein